MLLKKTQSRVSAALVALVTVTAGATLPSAAHATPAAMSPSNVVAAGMLTNAGRPVSDADVVAIAWPTQEVADTAPTGSPIDYQVLGVTKTGPDGAYSIRIDPGSVDPSFVEPDGRVKVEVIAGTASEEMRWHYTVFPAGWSAPNGHALGWQLGHPVAGQAPQSPETHLDLASATAVEAVSGGSTEQAEDGQDSAYVGARSPQLDNLVAAGTQTPHAVVSPMGQGGCGAVWGSYHYNRQEHFINVQPWSGAPATVTEAYGNDQTLGVGVEATDGDWATLKASGSMTLSFSVSDSMSGITTPESLFNRMNYRDSINNCGPDQRVPVSYYGLLTDQPVTISHAHFSASCVDKAANTHFTANQVTAFQFDTGTDIGPVSVIARAGWTDGTTLHFDFNKRTWLCGTDVSGPIYSKRVEAHDYSSGM